jgi:hypothetical protein
MGFTMTAPDTSLPVSTCDISGLPLTCRPEWIVRKPEQDCQLDVCLLGDIRHALVPKGHAYVLIEDVMHLRRHTLDARRLLIQGMPIRGRLCGIVFGNISPLMKVSITALAGFMRIVYGKSFAPAWRFTIRASGPCPLRGC